MRCVALLLLLALAVEARAATQVPKADLQLLAEAVRIIKQNYARPVEDARLATGCAGSLAGAAGGGARTARALEELPLLLEQAHAAAAGKIEYRDLAHHCVAGMAAMLDPDSRYVDAAERGASRGGGGAEQVNAVSLEGGVLQLRLQQFRDAARSDLLRELARVAGAGQGAPRTILLDLRDNQGGLLGAALELSGLFLAEGTELGAIQGRNKQLLASHRVLVRPYSLFPGSTLPEQVVQALRRAPLAILVNGHTGNGAEILAGALQANSRGVLVGQRTAGRGAIQTVYPLPGGAGLRLTSGFWQAAKGAELEGRPLEPDLPAAADAAARDALRWLGEWR